MFHTKSCPEKLHARKEFGIRWMKIEDRTTATYSVTSETYEIDKSHQQLVKYECYDDPAPVMNK